MTLLAIAGGITRIIERPELFSTLFAVITFVLADSYLRTRDWKFLVPLPLLCALWANVHAAVIVGLVLQILFIRSVPQVAAFVASVAAACVNPFGYRVLTVPFELTRIIDSGLLNNEEWRHPTLIKAPFYFVALGLVIASVWMRASARSAEARAEARIYTEPRLFVAFSSIHFAPVHPQRRLVLHVHAADRGRRAAESAGDRSTRRDLVRDHPHGLLPVRARHRRGVVFPTASFAR